ncbi:PrgH/EprH family type III secretion apparatus protein [Sodalis sp. (in: enterobacteria)]|uniref:PrgH/EprH family type III secretion apparatus protein n=1 Tax=Sodalis sp. (in: enterobacteria) TaxID=1898979 RepID=UPI003F3E8A45
MYLFNNALNDNTMAELQGFMEAYYSQWGNEFITFSINLDENWLLDKSYLAAPNGYVFVNPHTWYFPSVNATQ